MLGCLACISPRIAQARGALYLPGMSIFDRLFSRKPDPRFQMRPLYDSIVAIARQPAWYRAGVPDTLEGRFEMVMAVLSQVLLRLEGEDAVRQQSVWLTEVFVDDMDGQMRQIGIGDLTVGKYVGKMMAALGGRLGAYRSAEDANARAAVLWRNLGIDAPADAPSVAARLDQLVTALAQLPTDAIIAGDIPQGESA